MKRRPTRPFVVEVKRSRVARPTINGLHTVQDEAPAHEHPSVAVLPRDATDDLNGGPEHETARRAAETLFGRKPAPPAANGRGRSSGVAEISAPPPETVTAAPASRPNPVKEPATGRILPDLLTVDPLEERLRREAEERAARRRGPRGPRRVSEATSRPKPRSDGSAAGRAVIENAWEIGNMPVEFGAPETSTGFVRPVRRQVVTFAKSATRKTAPQRGLHSEWALRRACRKAKRTGAAMPLRAGERWKRRLPVSAW